MTIVVVVEGEEKESKGRQLVKTKIEIDLLNEKFLLRGVVEDKLLEIKYIL